MGFETRRQGYELKDLTNNELTDKIKDILKAEILDLDIEKLSVLAEKISIEAREFKKNSRNVGKKSTRYHFIHRQWNSKRREFENSITSVQDLTDFVIKMAVKEFKPKLHIDQSGVDKGVWRLED